MYLRKVIEHGRFDLHVHTTASDGIYTPQEVVQKAYQNGLKTIAITDHDTLDGVIAAQKMGQVLGIHVISGIELSTKYKGKNVDILGYHIDLNSRLNQTLTHIRQARRNRAEKIIQKLNELGMHITIHDVQKFSQGQIIARPHIARAIVQKGYVPSVQQVFDQFLADGKPCALDKMQIEPQKGIELIHQAGGEAVLAHPRYIGDDELVRELLSFNFDGLEVWHSAHNIEDRKRYKRIAQQFQLLMTGGSDFHDDTQQIGQFGDLKCQ